MRFLILLLSWTLLAAAANESWTDLKALKTGAELKVYLRGSAQPRQARFAEATDDNLIVVIKNEEVAIPRGEIDRVAARPASKGGPMVTRATKTTKNGENPPLPAEGPQGPTAGPARSYPENSSSSTSVGISRGNAEYQTVYRRTAPAQDK